ncbi:MAG TPA: transcriptional regulator CecR [Clostridia bacterium]|nr:transcriptional regulator CecR [Clostridia bacterium]
MNTQAFWTPTPSKSDQARIRLLEAAVAIFGEKGLEGATVREIAKRAGQNVAAIAYYFGSKEKLYFAVIEGIVRELRYRLGDEFAAIEAFRQAEQKSPEEALRLLKQFLCTVYVRLISRSESVSIARLIVREQTQPTVGFDLLYEKGFQPLHEALCFLVGTILGKNPRDRETMLRTTAVMGQVYFFAMAREGILRRLGWSNFEGKNADCATAVIAENIDVLMSGLMLKPSSE